MPILDVEFVVDDAITAGSGLATALADAAGEVFDTPPGRTWVRLRRISSEDYAENKGGPLGGVLPVFVTVLKARRPPPETLRAEIDRLTRAVARVLDRPAENVHVIYLPEGRGRVAFGGRLIEDRSS
jgi:phenylpyruvate tautomerase PptA (4-oxalocrotonate tautomerase family)